MYERCFHRGHNASNNKIQSIVMADRSVGSERRDLPVAVDELINFQTGYYTAHDDRCKILTYPERFDPAVCAIENVRLAPLYHFLLLRPLYNGALCICVHCMCNTTTAVFFSTFLAREKKRFRCRSSNYGLLKIYLLLQIRICCCNQNFRYCCYYIGFTAKYMLDYWQLFF